MTSAMVEFLYSLEWSTISVLASNEVYGVDCARNIQATAKEIGMTIDNVYYFKVGDHQELADRVTKIKESGTKVIVTIMTSDTDATFLLGKIKEMQLNTEGYIWMFDETFAYQPGISAKNVSLTSDSQGMFFVELNSGLWSSDLYFVGKFMQQYNYSSVEETYSQIQAFDVSIINENIE